MKRFIVSSFILGSLYLLMIGCSRQSAQLQFNQQGLKNLVNQSQTAVLQKLGQPDKIIPQENGDILWVYTTTYQQFSAPVSQIYMNPENSVSQINSAGLSSSFTPQVCVTTFTISDKIVKTVYTDGRCL
ncbi:MAG: hypothetical protein IKZ02_00995 [Alphaproteobacteria bacterium]|nr:hypothetical protein [Alphaproteobacteria bacterium]